MTEGGGSEAVRSAWSDERLGVESLLYGGLVLMLAVLIGKGLGGPPAGLVIFGAALSALAPYNLGSLPLAGAVAWVLWSSNPWAFDGLFPAFWGLGQYAGWILSGCLLVPMFASADRVGRAVRARPPGTVVVVPSVPERPDLVEHLGECLHLALGAFAALVLVWLATAAEQDSPAVGRSMAMAALFGLVGVVAFGSLALSSLRWRRISAMEARLHLLHVLAREGGREGVRIVEMLKKKGG